jgi:hypothetical protein
MEGLCWREGEFVLLVRTWFVSSPAVDVRLGWSTWMELLGYSFDWQVCSHLLREGKRQGEVYPGYDSIYTTGSSSLYRVV